MKNSRVQDNIDKYYDEMINGSIKGEVCINFSILEWYLNKDVWHFKFNNKLRNERNELELLWLAQFWRRRKAER